MSSSNASASRSRYLVPIVVVIVTVALIALVWFLQSKPAEQAAPVAPEVTESEEVIEETPEAVEEPEEVQEADFTELESRDPNDPMAVGPVDAPIGMVIFTDYQCMYCGKWNHDTLPTMLEYVDQGLLRIEWRDTNFFGPASETAAAAAYAAALQGKFLEYNDALFPKGEKRSESELSQEALIALAGELGLDVDQFTADMTSESTLETVMANATFAPSVGVTSTPTFTLGGVPIVGAQPTEVFVETFESTLAAKQG